MTRIQSLSMAFTLLLLLAGCNSTPQQPQPKPTAVTPSLPPTQSPVDAERERKEIDEQRRKSKSAYINKTDAYRKYVP